jgi:hypothetical protein
MGKNACYYCPGLVKKYCRLQSENIYELSICQSADEHQQVNNHDYPNWGQFIAADCSESHGKIPCCISLLIYSLDYTIKDCDGQIKRPVN